MTLHGGANDPPLSTNAFSPVESSRSRLERLREWEKELNDEQEQLRWRQEELEREMAQCGTARRRVRDVHRCIFEDEGGDRPHVFARASQNIATTAMLLRAMPEPSTLEGRQAHEELRALLDHAAVQQAESSASRQRGRETSRATTTVVHDREASVQPDDHQAEVRAPLAREHLGGDVRHALNVRRREEERARREYRPRCGGQYDSDEDGA